jgi:hypothetical protein
MHFPLIFGLISLLDTVNPSPVQIPITLERMPLFQNQYKYLGYNRTGSRKLQGRFLHITDLHPDDFYRVNATISSACHRPPKNPKTKKHSGYLGTPFTWEASCQRYTVLIDVLTKWLWLSPTAQRLHTRLSWQKVGKRNWFCNLLRPHSICCDHF